MVTQNASGWPKKITVDRKIVNLLSRSLYADFPRAIREAVSNSYDGDATVVKITVDRENSKVVIEDNGNGISLEQFDNYLSIAREKQAEFTEKFSRKRIGKFGIGFLAGFPFCMALEITSKREGADVGFTATIPTKRFAEGVGVQEDVSSIPVDGVNEPYLGKMHEHYTRIRMLGLTNTAEAFFEGHPKAKQFSIESWDGMARLKWQLCETLPLDYKNKSSDLASRLGTEPIGMSVFLNGEQLFRNELGGYVVASSEQTYIKLGNLEFKYAIATDWKIVHPLEARGLKIRIRNVGIGPRTYLEIEKEIRNYSRLYWLSGDVNVIRGLDESLALTRDNFIWSNEYQSLKEFFGPVLGKAQAQVENVAEVEKEISKVFRENAAPSVLAAEVVDRSIRRLITAGFDVSHTTRAEAESLKYPISIDKRNKIVTVVDDYEQGRVTPDSRQGDVVRIVKFENKRLSEPARFAEDGAIELNSNYPLFKGVGRGKVMKGLHVILIQAKRDCQNAEEMYGYIVRRLKEEFE